MLFERHDREALHARVRQIRREVYGETGIPSLAEALGVPPGTWVNFEGGVMIPATVILEFAALTGVNLDWLMRGKGDPFADRVPDQKARPDQSA